MSNYSEKYLKYKSKYNQLKNQNGGAGEIYNLINVDDESDVIEIDGNSRLTFNTDGTSQTFHETNLFMLGSIDRSYDRSATQCYSLDSIWYQLVNIENIIYQVKFDGSIKRRVHLKPTGKKLNDDEIVNLIVMKFEPSRPNPERYSEWETKFLQALNTGAADFMDVRRLIYIESKYLVGETGHTLIPRLREFIKKYPIHTSIIKPIKYN